MRAEQEKLAYKNGESEKWEMLNRVKQKEAFKKYEEDRRCALYTEEKRRQAELVKQIVRKKLNFI